MKKKLAATVATGILFAGVTVSSVSAAEVEVHKGDSLWKISQEHNTTVEQLMTSNNLQSTTIYPNQILVTGEEGETKTETSYTVKKGDTLSRISNELGVSVANLKGWNNLTSDLILVGQVLALNGNNAAAPAVEVTEETEVSTENQGDAVTEEPKAEVTEAPAEKEKAAPQEQKAVKEEPKAEVTEAPKEEVKNETEQAHEKSAEGKTISVSATAYTAECNGCSGVTATGVDLNANPGAKVIAVDPNVIPLGSKVYVEGYGYATAADTGGAIQGNKIDVHVGSKDQAYGWGVKNVNVTIVE